MELSLDAMPLMRYIHAFPSILLIMTMGIFCMAVSIKYLLFSVGTHAVVWASTVSVPAKILMLLAQYAVIVSFYELREYLVEGCRERYRTMDRKYVRFSIVYSNLIWAAGTYACLLHLWSLPKFFDVYVIIESLVLSVWIWEWCGIAVPMSAKRYWKGLFSRKVFESKDENIRILPD